jgi:hypothetical protein
MTADQLAEHLFDVASQLYRGAARLIHRDEKAQVARIDLRAGQRAKASAAYASACVYLSAGMALLDERDWGSQYELMFHLRLERAECEFLTSNFVQAEQLIGELLQRAVSRVDLASRVRGGLEQYGGPADREPDRPAADVRSGTASRHASTLGCFGRRLPYRFQLVLLAPMPDGECQLGARYWRRFCAGLAWLGTVLGPKFNRHSDGYRFAKLACGLVEKHGFVAYKTTSYLPMQRIALWTQPIATAIEFNRAAFRTATEAGTLSWACY